MKSDSKFKVGDKVRVISNEASNNDGRIGSNGFSTGIIGDVIGQSDYSTGVYVQDKNGDEYVIHPDDLELITPLTFDHEKALQGSPVYLDGDNVSPYFIPISKKWVVDNKGNKTWFYINGVFSHGYTTGPITTIPPEVYVEESRWVWVYPTGYKTKEEAEKGNPNNDAQLCEVKIKVKK